MDALFLSKSEIYNGNYRFRKFSHNNEFTNELHYHDFYELQFWLCESENDVIGEITINGIKRELRQGCMVLVNMFDVHQYTITCTVPYTRYCINFDPSLLLFACSEKTDLFDIFSNCSDDRFFRPLNPSQISILTDIYREQENISLVHGRDIMDKALIFKIFAYVYNIFYDGHKIPKKESKYLSTITELISYIGQNLSGDLSLKQLADHVNFSTFHLSRIFKQYTGTTLNQYVIVKRIDKAKSLLQTSRSIDDVSRESGFHNYNHFYRTFKSVTGFTPSEYKNQC